MVTYTVAKPQLDMYNDAQGLIQRGGGGGGGG